MGKRGPKPDADQAAKGYPGRRRTRADRAATEAARIAVLLAPTKAAAELPGILMDPKYAAAAAVWRKLAPELRRTHRLLKDGDDIFAMYCIYAQEWTMGTEELHTRGFTQLTKTVVGGRMERRRPQVQDRETAFKNLLLLSGHFGLTTSDMHNLFKGQAAVATTNPGLFGERVAPEPEPVAEIPSLIGTMSRHRGVPPGERPN